MTRRRDDDERLAFAVGLLGSAIRAATRGDFAEMEGDINEAERQANIILNRGKDRFDADYQATDTVTAPPDPNTPQGMVSP
jgi:hypothetical protein